MTCYVPFCKSDRHRPGSKENKLSFHGFPVDPILREKWIRAICRKGKDGGYWLPSETAVVCSRHFDASSYKEGFKVRLLKKGSVPNVFEDYPEHRRPKPTSPTQRENQKSLSSKNKVCSLDSADPTKPHNFHNKDSLSILADECYNQSEAVSANIENRSAENNKSAIQTKSLLESEGIKQSTNIIDLTKFLKGNFLTILSDKTKKSTNTINLSNFLNGNFLHVLPNEHCKQSKIAATNVENISAEKYLSNATQSQFFVANEFVKQSTNAVHLKFHNYNDKDSLSNEEGFNQNGVAAPIVKNGTANQKFNISRRAKSLLARQRVDQNTVATLIIKSKSDANKNCSTETKTLSDKGVSESTADTCDIENIWPVKTFKCGSTQTKFDSQKLDSLTKNNRMMQRTLYAYKTRIENLKYENKKLKREINIYEKLCDWVNRD